MIALITAASSGPPSNVVEWFTESGFRTRSGPIPDQVWATLWHSTVALVLAMLIALPLAVVLAHFRRGELVASWTVNVGRAIPTIAFLGVAVIVSLRQGFGFEPWPIILALLLLALPPLFANTYTAVRGVDPDAVDAARAMGLPESGIMRRVELPLALPLMFVGVRTAAVQVIATEPIAAFFGAEGLGAYIRQGLGNDDLYQVQAGALLVTAVAIGADAALWMLSRAVTPESIRHNAGRRPRSSLARPSAPITDPTPAT